MTPRPLLSVLTTLALAATSTLVGAQVAAAAPDPGSPGGPGGAVASGKDLSRSIELFHRVNEQDFDAAERCQLAANSRAYANGGVLVPSEHHIGLFHEWVSQHLDAGVGHA